MTNIENLTDVEKIKLKRQIADEIVTPALENAVGFVNDSLRNIGIFGSANEGRKSNLYSPERIRNYLKKYG